MPKPALPRLILLPGLDGSGVFFDSLRAALKDKVTTNVLAYPADGPQTYEALAAALLPKLPDEDYVLVAESFGGPLAILLAAQAEHKPQALILAASFARNPLPMAGLLLKFVLPTLPGLLAAKPLPAIEATLLRSGDHELALRVYHEISKLEPEILSERLKTVTRCDVRKPLKSLDLPILYLQGAEDRLISKAHGLLIQATGQRVRIASVEAPHFILQYDAETTVRDHILPLLRTLP